ncbi:uncharacterized protein LOC131224667 isoform X1 [Magnolia sinica]|uniref:uncharacterized protein LOC131224667 isoform X1 n=1 Tax=Magnolia sinica TaxID=86752 RepID=UPI002659E3FD|nr:uncharacterized protein LOC131224667 isoform X1 [Magnolia sinica]
MEGRAGKPLTKASRQVGKNQRKNNTKKANEADTIVESVASVSTTAKTGHVSDGAKPKGRGAPKKAPTRKVCLQILNFLFPKYLLVFVDSSLPFWFRSFSRKCRLSLIVKKKMMRCSS